MVLKRFRYTLGAGFVALLLLMATLIGVGLHQLQQVRNNLEAVVADHNHKVNIVTNLQVAGYRRSDSLYAMLLMRDPFERDALFAVYNRAGFDVGSARVDLRALLLSDRELEIHDRQTDLITQVVEVQDGVVDLLVEEDYLGANELMLSSVIPLQEAINLTFNELREVQMAATRDAVESAHAAFIATRDIFFAIGLGFLLIGSAVALAVYRKIRSQAATINENLHALAESHRKLEHAASHDALTGLPNRVCFQEHLAQVLAEAARSGESFALFYLDLDRFKQVNDSFGHHAGDSLLCAAAERLRNCLRGYDLVFRLGGDEFAAVVRGIASPDMAAAIATKMAAALDRPFTIEGREARIGTSIGISLYPQHGQDDEQLVRSADDAMYEAKRAGRNGFRFATTGTG